MAAPCCQKRRRSRRRRRGNGEGMVKKLTGCQAASAPLDCGGSQTNRQLFQTGSPLTAFLMQGASLVPFFVMLARYREQQPTGVAEQSMRRRLRQQ